MHVPHSKDAGKYNGPRGRRFAPDGRRFAANAYPAWAVSAAGGFESEQAASEDASKHHPSGDFAIVEWPTFYGPSFEWYSPKNQPE